MNTKVKLAIFVSVSFALVSLLVFMFQNSKESVNTDSAKLYSWDIFNSDKIQTSEQYRSAKQGDDKTKFLKPEQDSKSLLEYVKKYQSTSYREKPKDNTEADLRTRQGKTKSAEDEFLSILQDELAPQKQSSSFKYNDFSISYSKERAPEAKEASQNSKLKMDMNVIAQAIISSHYSADKDKAVQALNDFVKHQDKNNAESVRRVAEKYKRTYKTLEELQVSSDAELVKNKLQKAYKKVYDAMLDLSYAISSKELLDKILTYNKKADELVYAMLFTIDFVEANSLQFEAGEPGAIFVNPFAK